MSHDVGAYVAGLLKVMGTTPFVARTSSHLDGMVSSLGATSFHMACHLPVAHKAVAARTAKICRGFRENCETPNGDQLPKAGLLRKGFKASIDPDAKCSVVP